MNTLTYNPHTVSGVFLAETKFDPIYVWEDGRRTDMLATDENGAYLYQIRDVKCVIDGQELAATFTTDDPIEIPAGSIVKAKAKPVVKVRANAVSNTYADLAFNVFSEEWVVIGNLAEVMK